MHIFVIKIVCRERLSERERESERGRETVKSVAKHF